MSLLSDTHGDEGQGASGARADGQAPDPDRVKGRLGWLRRVLDVVLVAALPLVLIGVGMNQLYLAKTADLTPWKGGGFGMFASPDRHSYRAVRGSFETELGTIPTDHYSLQRRTEGADRKAFVNARALPDARRVDRWAAVVASASWRIDDGLAVFDQWLSDGAGLPTLLDSDSGEPIMVTAYTIEVWAVQYSTDTKLIEPRLTAVYRYEGTGNRQ